MRHNQLPFCRVCDFTIRSRLGRWQVPRVFGEVAVGPATAVGFARTGESCVVTYDISNGHYALRRIELGPRTSSLNVISLAPPDATIDPGWTAFVPVRVANRDTLLLAHAFATGRRALFRFSPRAVGTSTLDLVRDLGPALNQPWTSLSSFQFAGATHVLGYDRFDGEALLVRVDPGTLAETEVASWRTPGATWQTGWDHVIAMTNRGTPHVVRLSSQGPRDVSPLLPFGRRPDDWAASSEPDKFGALGFTHATVYDTRDGAHLVRYAAFNGFTSVEALRPSGASFDVAARTRFPPNALSFFGVGAPVLASAAVDADIAIAFAHAPTGSLQLYRSGPAGTSSV
jgi:hypothetical protein